MELTKILLKEIAQHQVRGLFHYFSDVDNETFQEIEKKKADTERRARVAQKEKADKKRAKKNK